MTRNCIKCEDRATQNRRHGGKSGFCRAVLDDAGKPKKIPHPMRRLPPLFCPKEAV